jgi:hypothetical protein
MAARGHGGGTDEDKWNSDERREALRKKKLRVGLLVAHHWRL